VIVTHGHRQGAIGFLTFAAAAVAYKLGLLTRARINRWIARQLYRRFPWADVVVFGHTHRPYEGWIGQTFFFNPGAVSQTTRDPPSVGLLTLGRDVLDTEIVPLSDLSP
jgi:hypothetical protein